MHKTFFIYLSLQYICALLASGARVRKIVLRRFTAYCLISLSELELKPFVNEVPPIYNWALIFAACTWQAKHQQRQLDGRWATATRAVWSVTKLSHRKLAFRSWKISGSRVEPLANSLQHCAVEKLLWIIENQCYLTRLLKRGTANSNHYTTPICVHRQALSSVHFLHHVLCLFVFLTVLIWSPRIVF